MSEFPDPEDYETCSRFKDAAYEYIDEEVDEDGIPSWEFDIKLFVIYHRAHDNEDKIEEVLGDD